MAHAPVVSQHAPSTSPAVHLYVAQSAPGFTLPPLATHTAGSASAHVLFKQHATGVPQFDMSHESPPMKKESLALQVVCAAIEHRPLFEQHAPVAIVLQSPVLHATASPR